MSYRQQITKHIYTYSFSIPFPLPSRFFIFTKFYTYTAVRITFYAIIWIARTFVIAAKIDTNLSSIQRNWLLYMRLTIRPKSLQMFSFSFLTALVYYFTCIYRIQMDNDVGRSVARKITTAKIIWNVLSSMCVCAAKVTWNGWKLPQMLLIIVAS